MAVDVGEGALVGVGDPAPDFALAGTPGGQVYRLSELRGRPVVLAFYPGDATPVCTVQMQSYNAGLAQFDELGAQVLGISPQSVESHESFSEASGPFAFPLLADTDRSVARAYGVLGPIGFYRRCTFVGGADGVIRYAPPGPAGPAVPPGRQPIAGLP